MERLEFDLLFRCFVSIGLDDAAWNHSTFSKNRDRLLERRYRSEVHAGRAPPTPGERLLSTDHFSQWHAGRSLGLDEEFQAERWIGRTSAC